MIVTNFAPAHLAGNLKLIESTLCDVPGLIAFMEQQLGVPYPYKQFNQVQYWSRATARLALC